MRFSTDALVIMEKSIGESDRLVTLMTRDRGIIKAFASGAKSIKSRRGAATGLLSFSNFQIECKADTYRITEAVPIKIFRFKNDNLENFYLSQYFCELSIALYPSDTSSEEFLRLILNSLNFLCESSRSPSIIKAITELRIASLSGYMPNLIACEGCGKFEDNTMYFSFTDGHLFCENCKEGSQLVPINRTVLQALRHIVYSEFGKLYSFEIPKSDEKTLSSLTERYIIVQTEKNYKTLDFYNGII